LHERPRSFYPTFARKDSDQGVTHYCPGCGHGNLHKFIAEAVDDLGIGDRTIFVNPVGCSVFAYYYLDMGHVQAPHGRAPAVATAIKRARPDSIVIVYQGDGDLAAIGGNEILHAANRGESLTVIFVNNAIYGMTGGQMAPTTLLGQTTSTSPFGRSARAEGYPLRVCELLGSLEAPVYLERVALGDAKRDMAARKAVRRALQNQVEGRGFSLVEVLSPCPTGWKLSPQESTRFVLETMTRTFPLKRLRGDAEPAGAQPPAVRPGEIRDYSRETIPEILGLVSGGPDSGSSAPAEDWTLRDVQPRFRQPRIKAAGFGGQGVLFLGALIAEAGMRAGWDVSWLPSYGPEMRGGTAHCHVILSESEVDSPLVTRSSVLFAFNQPSLERFCAEVTPDGLIVYDSSMVTTLPSGCSAETIGVPATELAEKLGSKRMANLVALGAYLRKTSVLPASAVEAALRGASLKPEVIASNLRALQAGMNYVAGGG
jgi:2-oxoisovalerate ferredoxin oxidoreductase beta subunit